MSVGTTAAACVGKKIFRVVRGWPWRLAAGSIEDKLGGLAAGGDVVSDPVTWITKALLSMGCSRNALASGIRFLRGVPWSTAGVGPRRLR